MAATEENVYKGGDYWNFYYQYITNHNIGYQMVAAAKKREFAFLASERETRTYLNTRTCLIPTLKDYLWWIQRGQAIQEKRSYMNFYISTARYINGIPSIPWGKEKKAAKEKWNRECDDNIIDYPFLLDIDVESHDEVYLGLKDVAKILIKMIEEKGWYNITVTFSGMGFHILVPMEIVTKNRNFNEKIIVENELHVKPRNTIYEEYKVIAKEFYNDCSAKIDLKIYDHSRLMKMPFSVVSYENEAYIAHSFNSIPELLDFSLPYFELRNYHSYPLNVFKKLGAGKLGIPVCVKKWQDENEKVQHLKRLRIE